MQIHQTSNAALRGAQFNHTFQPTFTYIALEGAMRLTFRTYDHPEVPFRLFTNPVFMAAATYSMKAKVSKQHYGKSW